MVPSEQKCQKCTFRDSNLHLLVELEVGKNLRGFISTEGQKCTFIGRNVHLFVELKWKQTKSTWWHFNRKARSVHFELQTCIFLCSWSGSRLISIGAFEQPCLFRN